MIDLSGVKNVEGSVRKRRGEMSAIEMKACLKSLRWSQPQFARYICVSVSTVKKWAQGRTKIPGPVVILLHLLLKEKD